MGYLRKRYKKKNDATHDSYASSSKGELYTAATIMQQKVEQEKFNHFLGEVVYTISPLVLEKGGKKTKIAGRVIGIYPHFLLLDCGKFKQTVSYINLVLDE